MKKTLFTLLILLSIVGIAQADTTVYGGFLPSSGGNITGNLSVSGTISGTVITDTTMVSTTAANTLPASTGNHSCKSYVTSTAVVAHIAPPSGKKIAFSQVLGGTDKEVTSAGTLPYETIQCCQDVTDVWICYEITGTWTLTP